MTIVFTVLWAYCDFLFVGTEAKNKWQPFPIKSLVSGSPTPHFSHLKIPQIGPASFLNYCCSPWRDTPFPGRRSVLSERGLPGKQLGVATQLSERGPCSQLSILTDLISFRSGVRSPWRARQPVLSFYWQDILLILITFLSWCSLAQ